MGREADGARWALVLASIAGCETPERAVALDGTSGFDLDTTSVSSEAASDDEWATGPIFDVSEPPPEPVVHAEPPPPPVSGGTLLLSRDEALTFVADPDRDQIFVVDAVERRLLHAIAFERGMEPGRLVEDDAGRVHVAMRRGGAVVSIDPDAGEIVAEHDVCANPRGLVHDPSDDSLLVACAEGVLARVFPDGEVSRVDVRVELRDVVDVGPPIRVSTFRDARVLTVAEDGSITQQQAAPRLHVVSEQVVEPDPDVEAQDVLLPNTARRSMRTSDGGWAMLHQAASTEPLPTSPQRIFDSYGGSTGNCRPIQAPIVTRWSPVGDTSQSVSLTGVTIALDFAVSPDEDRVAVVGWAAESSVVAFFDGVAPRTVAPTCFPFYADTTDGDATAVVFDADGRAWVQLREPAALAIYSLEEGISLLETIALSDTSVADTGHELFHRPTGAAIACASCHPEGRDDAHTWRFQGVGKRRTPALGVRLEGTEPFHWQGDMADMREVFDEVRVRRMGGRELTTEHADALERWVFAIPPMNVPMPADPEAVARGEQLFADVGCTACHSGPSLTNNQTVEVAGLPAMQVPPLTGVRWRAPYLHDGSALDLETAVERMLPEEMSLDPQSIADLVAYLRSL